MRAVIARRVYLVILLIAAAACACTRRGSAGFASSDNESASAEVKVEVTSVGLDRNTGANYVLLQDQSQSRALPILIGDNEAQAIMLELHGLKAPRPLTHDLMRDIITQTGNHIDRVVIADVHDEIYFAKIFIDHGRHGIDSRPSDAIALAMGTNAPIYVNEKLLQPSSDLDLGRVAQFPKSEHQFGMTVQDLTPELAAYFNVPPRCAVLVAEVGTPARDAGVERGDLLVRIDGKAIAGLRDFDVDIATHKDDAPVTLIIRRKDGEHSVTITPDNSAKN